MKKRWIIALCLLAAGALAAQAVGTGTKSVVVSTAEVGRGNFERTAEVSGQAVAKETYTAMPSVSGRVRRVYVSEGQKVKKGARLFSFDDTAAQNALKQAQFELDAAIAAQKASALAALAEETQAVEVLAQASGSELAQANGDALAQASSLALAQASNDALALASNEALESLQAEVAAAQAQSYEALMQQIVAHAQSESVDLGLLNKAVEAYAVFGGGVSSALQTPENASVDANKNAGIKEDTDINKDINVNKILDTGTTIMNAPLSAAMPADAQVNAANAQALVDAQAKRAEELAASVPDGPEVLLSREKVRQAQEALKGMTMTSAIDGEVLGVSLKAGEIAAAGTGAVVVGDTGNMRVTLRVPEYELKFVKTGQAVRLDANGITGTGKVIKRGSALLSGAYGETYASVEVEPDAGFTPLVGASVEAEIILDFAEDTLYIPRECVLTQEDGSYVFAVQEGVARKKAVVTGLENDYFVELISGVVLGEVLVVGPYDLVDGGLVTEA